MRSSSARWSPSSQVAHWRGGYWVAAVVFILRVTYLAVAGSGVRRKAAILATTAGSSKAEPIASSHCQLARAIRRCPPIPPPVPVVFLHGCRSSRSQVRSRRRIGVCPWHGLAHPSVLLAYRGCSRSARKRAAEPSRLMRPDPTRLLPGAGCSCHGACSASSGLRATPARIRSFVARARMSGRHRDTSTSPGSTRSSPVNSSWICADGRGTAGEVAFS
jgi:hypothetical protein